jgi:hypothetical protein
VSPLPVKPAFGPTLPALAGPLWRRAPRALRIVAAAATVVLVALVVVAAVRGGPGASGERHVVVERPIAYNLRHHPALRRVEPRAGESLRLEARRDGLFLQSFAVTSLELPPYRGAPSGPYAIAAEGLKDRLARRFDAFELVQEGRARINQVPGYQVVFTARSAEGRRLYGRWVMLVPLTDPPTPQRRGVTLELLGTPAAGIPNAEEIGDVGQLKLPLRSFRFGTEAP